MKNGELSPTASPIAREVHRRMQTAGLTKKSLARLAGVGETYVHDIFRGKSRNPKGDQFAKVAAVLETTVDELRNPGRPGSEEQRRDFAQDPEEVALLNMWRSLSRPARGLVLLRIREIAARAARGGKVNNAG